MFVNNKGGTMTTRSGDGFHEPCTVEFDDADENRALELLEERADREIETNADLWREWLLDPISGPDGGDVAALVSFALSPPVSVAGQIDRSRIRHAYHEYREEVARSGDEWNELLDQVLAEAEAYTGPECEGDRL